MTHSIPALPRRSLRAGVPDDVRFETRPVQTADGLTLALQRFSRGDADRVILLLHGETGSTDMFVLPEIDNLVSTLLDEGWPDVWSLDWRSSNRLPYNRGTQRYSVDDVALFDLPAALETLRQEVGDRPIYVIAHCVGALALGMAMAAGTVRGLAGVVANAAFLTTRFPGSLARMKAVFTIEALEKLLRIDYVPIRFDEVGFRSPQALLFLGASLGRSTCDNTTCQLLSFLWGAGDPSLFLHENLKPETHDGLDQLLGDMPLGYHKHLRKMDLAGAPVRWNTTSSVYDHLPDNYLLERKPLDTPILLVTGQENRIWGTSNVTCHQVLKERDPKADVELEVIPRYGHIDVFIGRNAALDVFPRILRWLDARDGEATATATAPTNAAIDEPCKDGRELRSLGK